MKGLPIMRKRYQTGCVNKEKGKWMAQWWEDGHRRKRTLGKCSAMTKAQAQAELASIVAPVNARSATPSAAAKLGDFVSNIYLPFYRRKWKRSSAMTNEDRLRVHILPFAPRTLGSFNRDELQDFLDEKARGVNGAGLSYSVVAHLRWDLRQIFRMAVSEGYVPRNPAELLFIPREAKRPVHRAMTTEEVQKCFEALDPRERLITKFAVLAGMRPGEILALRWERIAQTHAEITQRIYRGDLDLPKSDLSFRKAAIPQGLAEEIELWRGLSTDPQGWVFPSEKNTPLSRDNVLRRHIAPKLEAVGLGWVDFHVMRRTHASLMNEIHDDPKLVADQMGHTVDVNQHVYTRASVARRRKAVDRLESTVIVMPVRDKEEPGEAGAVRRAVAPAKAGVR
jgi:integrase